ncbi:UNVERIFIED_CONTAM: hypothetical protein HDU68_006266 [Siphonaria sp. JEL0065]|nr:hypothetical protein HDU68_006266 [Siphonaria sp. JEL0065]
MLAIIYVLILSATTILSAPASSKRTSYSTSTALAILSPTANSTISGTLSFTQHSYSNQVNIQLIATGFSPNTIHGIHIHKFGDLSDPSKALKLGGHFNPMNVSHGCPDQINDGVTQLFTGFHLGDMGSIVSDENGNVVHEWESNELSLDNPTIQGYVLGRGVIVHSLVDDCNTQPTGNSGDRLAQGIIVATQDTDAVFPSKNVGSTISVFPVSSKKPSGVITISDSGSIRVNMTGFPAYKSITVALTASGDLRNVKTSSTCSCDISTPSNTISLASFTADGNGCVVQTESCSVTDTRNIVIKLLGRGLLVFGNETDCPGGVPVAVAPIGLQFKE